MLDIAENMPHYQWMKVLSQIPATLFIFLLKIWLKFSKDDYSSVKVYDINVQNGGIHLPVFLT